MKGLCRKKTLHCTILLENKRAQHGNVSPVMRTETDGGECEPPTFDRDAAMLALSETAPRLFTVQPHAESRRPAGCASAAEDNREDARRRESGHRYPLQNNPGPRGTRCKITQTHTRTHTHTHRDYVKSGVRARFLTTDIHRKDAALISSL